MVEKRDGPLRAVHKEKNNNNKNNNITANLISKLENVYYLKYLKRNTFRTQ